MLRRIALLFLAAFLLVVAFAVYQTGILSPIILPLLPFYHYYGIEPPNNSWQNCKGLVTHMYGAVTSTDNNKKFDYWTVRAIKENDPNLCKNVGIYEGGDIIYPDEHKEAIKTCEYIFKKNPTFIDECGNIY